MGRDSSENLKQAFPFLHEVLEQNEALGVCLSGSSLDGCRFIDKASRFLKYYYADASTDQIIEHNRNWALGNVPHPIFQFAYLMLPNTCNQRCRGCFMGKDKSRLPEHLSGPYFFDSELSKVLSFLREHGAKAVIYGGGGELFTWGGAFDFIETVTAFGLRMVIFTNGTLLSRADITRLNKLGVVLIISLRDTVQAYHDSLVSANLFTDTLSTIESALSEGFHLAGRLAVEIPVTKDNERRVIEDFLPAMRYLGIVPMVEEYIQISTSDSEKDCCHNFSKSRRFFEEISQKDLKLGVTWTPEFGQRMIAQPQCRRPLYSFAIFPSRDVMDCPSHSVCYGNLLEKSLEDIIYSPTFKKAILDFSLCACSVFYTRSQNEIPQYLPDYLVVLR